MTLIIEDGTGKADSNTYASDAELTAYALARGIAITGTNEALLLRAMDFIEAQNFKGSKVSKEQALQWPRFNVWIDGFSIDSNEIPQELIEAQIEAALAVDAGNDPSDTVGRATKKEKVDVIEVEYMDGAGDDVSLTALNNKLEKLLRTAGNGISAVVFRA